MILHSSKIKLVSLQTNQNHHIEEKKYDKLKCGCEEWKKQPKGREKAQKPVKFESGRVGLEAKQPLFDVFLFYFLTYDYGCILNNA